MRFKSKIINGVDYRYFYCPHAHEQVGEGGCSKEFMREDKLNEVVWNSVKPLIEAAGDLEGKLQAKKDEADRESAVMARELSELQREREKCDAERFKNVDQFMAGNLDKDIYQSRRQDLMRTAEALDRKIAELEEKLRDAGTAEDDEVQKTVETLKGFSGETELTQNMVQALIEKVLVYDPEHVEIRWEFGDEVIKLLEYSNVFFGWRVQGGFGIISVRNKSPSFKKIQTHRVWHLEHRLQVPHLF